MLIATVQHPFAYLSMIGKEHNPVSSPSTPLHFVPDSPPTVFHRKKRSSAKIRGTASSFLLCSKYMNPRVMIVFFIQMSFYDLGQCG